MRLHPALAPLSALFGLLGAPAGAWAAVGPDYQAPSIESPGNYRGAADQTKPAETDLKGWWAAWGDPELEALEIRAANGNLTLQQAVSTVRQARLRQVQAGAGGLPQVIAEARGYEMESGDGKIMLPGFAEGVSPTFKTPNTRLELLQVGLDASWEPDFFGLNRRRREAAAAAAEASVWSERAARLLVAAEAASDYLELRGVQARILVARAQCADLDALAEAAAAQAAVGSRTGIEADEAIARASAARAKLATLEAEADRLMDALSVISGQPPEALMADLKSPSAVDCIPEPPPVPIGLPSELLRRRPDIRAAERNLAEATAQVGIATAELYPHFSLTAGPDLTSASLLGLVETGGAGWLAVGAMNWPIFTQGRVKAQISLAKEGRDQALLHYRETVLDGLRDVEDFLSSRAAADRSVAAASKAALKLKDAADAAQHSREAGLVTGMQALETHLLALQAQDDLVKSQMAISASSVGLYKALGGGWERP